jgi:hypothetical protein
MRLEFKAPKAVTIKRRRQSAAPVTHNFSSARAQIPEPLEEVSRSPEKP